MTASLPNRSNYWLPGRTAWRITITLVLATVIFSLFHGAVEAIYSSGIYRWLSRALRFFTGFISISVGDILYISLIITFLTLLIVWFYILFKRGISRKGTVRLWSRVLFILAWSWLIFQWSWGLNYSRKGSAFQLGLHPPEQFDTSQLVRLADTMSHRLQSVISVLTPADTSHWGSIDFLRSQSVASYKLVSGRFSFLQYHTPSVKASLVPFTGSYGGFSGYYNPFSGEAQVDDMIPAYLLPFVMCHEIGHQLGYAAEQEANLVGFLAASNSTSVAFRYSAYHDMLVYTLRELGRIDSSKAASYWEEVPVLARQHRQQAIDYYKRFKNPLQPFFNLWYHYFLKWNKQDKGLQSYSYVTAWLIAYGNKYGWEKL